MSTELASSYSSAAEVASKYSGKTSEAILAGAADAFTQGKTLAIGVALALTLIGLVTVLIAFPNKDQENEYYQKVLTDKN